MKSTATTAQVQERLAFKNANISKVEGLRELLCSFTKRVSISYSSDSTIQTYEGLYGMSACSMAAFLMDWRQTRSSTICTT